MPEVSAPFAPDWVSCPGESILDAIEERSWTQSELAKRLGYSEKFVNQLLNGKVALTQDVCEKLEKVVGGSVEFWMDREANYQRHLARHEAAKQHSAWVPWLKELPVRELMACGAINKVRIDEKNSPSIVANLLKFFGVATPNEWRNHYAGMQASFRRSREEQSNVGAISAWLRLGEQEAEKVSILKFNKTKFEQALVNIRALTCESPDVFEPRMRKELFDAGVLLIFVPAIPKSHVSGVARWLGPTRPIIQMSLYGKTNDKFWFTFFHEAAHILLHSSSSDEKKSVFLDDPNAAKSTDPQEHEANLWAGNFLIPEAHEPNLSTLKTKAAVKDFASRIGVHPGIVAGRLQHDKYVEPSWFNDLKVSFSIRTS